MIFCKCRLRCNIVHPHHHPIVQQELARGELKGNQSNNKSQEWRNSNNSRGRHNHNISDLTRIPYMDLLQTLKSRQQQQRQDKY